MTHWVHYRKCPECGSRHYTRTRAYIHYRTFKDGKRISIDSRVSTDMGNFTCEECGYVEGEGYTTHGSEYVESD